MSTNLTRIGDRNSVRPRMSERRAGCGKAACPVLRGAEAQLVYGRDIVAPSGNQTETENTNFTPEALEGLSLLDNNSADVQVTIRPGFTHPLQIRISAD